MQRAFTDKQLIGSIRSLTRQAGFPPSIRELADDLGVRSSETVHGALVRLQREGLVTWRPNTPRTLRLVKKR